MDIKRSNQVPHLSTNLVSKTNKNKAILPDCGKVWYNDKSIANIFSLTNLVKKYRVTYDSHQYYAFTIHTNRGIIKFKRNKQVIYGFNPTYTTSNSNVVTTVEENMVRFTTIKIERYKLSR